VRLLLCNAAAGLSDLEEAWVVASLYREDKLNPERRVMPSDGSEPMGIAGGNSA
jgi:hypothetical protein